MGRRTPQSQVPGELENWTKQTTNPWNSDPTRWDLERRRWLFGEIVADGPWHESRHGPRFVWTPLKRAAIQLCTPRKKEMGQSMGKRTGSLGGKGRIPAGWNPSSSRHFARSWSFCSPWMLTFASRWPRASHLPMKRGRRGATRRQLPNCRFRLRPPVTPSHLNTPTRGRDTRTRGHNPRHLPFPS
jgi:hypothetical protein